MCFKINNILFDIFLIIKTKTQLLINLKRTNYFFKKIKFFLLYVTIFYIVFVEKKETILSPKNYQSDEGKELIDNFYNLIDIKNLNNSLNDSMILDGKENIIKTLFESNNKNVSDSFEGIIFRSNTRFGNTIVILNKLLFYFEIFGLKHIILDKKDFWFLKNTSSIYIQKPNITIEIKDNSEFAPDKVLNIEIMFYYAYKIKPEVKIGYIRDEIIRNLIKVNLPEDCLFIHIRSGDIFSWLVHQPYAQPPLCFYQKIIENFNFSRIYLLTSEEHNNPVVGKLIELYPNIIFKLNSLEVDISLLANAYNLVVSISSFVNSIIQLNINLKYVWDYNIYHNVERNRQLHYDLYKFPHNNFTIFRMQPSFYYRSHMYIWRNTRRQLNLMMTEKCINDFILIKREK